MSTPRWAILWRRHAGRGKPDYSEEFIFTKTWPNIEKNIHFDTFFAAESK